MSLRVSIHAAWAQAGRAVQDRLLGIGIGVPASVVLGIARRLEADSSGVGTHTQLGLGACSVLSATGWPCPMCGMTTTFTHLAHGAIGSAITTQPFGVVLFAATVLLAGAGLADAFWPAGRLRRLAAWAQQRELPLALFVLAGMGFGWAYKAWLMGKFAASAVPSP